MHRLRFALLFVPVIACGGDSGGDGDGDPTDVFLEAEDFATTVPDGLVDWIEITDSNASNAKAMVVLNGLATTCSPTPLEVATACQPQMTFDVEITAEGMYFVHLVGRPQEMEAGSAWTFFDGGAASLTVWTEGQSSYNFPMTGPPGQTLTEGMHTFSVAVSEDGTTLDRIAITSSETAPDL